MSDNSNNPQLNQLVSFIQHDIPGLEDGKYQLNVSQQVTDAKGHIVSDDSLSVSYRFAVTGDRFRLSKPTELVYSVFPAENASGEYNTVLPNVVFTKTTFPWSRYPTKTLNEEFDNAPPSPGQDTDVDMSTWLTVILLDEDDVANYAGQYPSFKLTPADAAIGDLFLSSANPQSTLGTNYSYFYGVTDQSQPLSTYLDPGDQLTDTVQILDIPLELFFKIAPTINDLSLMAHVRKVSLINKPTMPGISDVGEPEGSFSIVFGNRLPNPMKKTYAYLVSLEEMEDFLPTSEDGGAPDNQDGFTPDISKLLRLAVLKSWNFYSTGESATFVDQLNALNNAAPPVNHETNADLAANTNLRLTCPEAAIPIVKAALGMGYVPLNHNLRAAEYTSGVFTIDRTVSWYRGPLAPYQIDKAAINLPIPSPDKATIFDPTTGMLDVSYAAAWTLGRQMALQDTSFSTALYNWKKGVSQDVLNSVENSVLSESFSAVFASIPAQSASLKLKTGETTQGDTLAADVQVRRPLQQKPPAGSFLRNAILSLKQPKN